MSYSNSSELKAGEQIVEHMRLISLVGSDAEGSIWEAIHAYEGRVAVKVLDADGAVSAPVLDEGTTLAGQRFVVCDLEHAQRLLLPARTRKDVSYQHLHDQVTCRPPMRRNWLPVVAAAAVVILSGLFGAGLF